MLTFQSNITNLKALTMDNYKGELVIEELRLKVPADLKAAWLNAEKEIWEPWLSSQMVFWGDNYFGIKKRRSFNIGKLKSKKLWKSIPMKQM